MAPYHPPTGDRLEKMRLDFNENTIGCSPKVLEALHNGLSREGLSVYPDYSRVKSSLANYFGVRPEEFLLTNGTDEAIQILIRTYIDAGQEVLILRPSYAMYKFYAEVADARIIQVDYPVPSLRFPLESLLAAITPATRAILIGNPNNPTGTAIDVVSIERILAAAPNAAVLIDEAYFEFFGVTALSHIVEFQNLFVSRTFSKAFGMAGMRLGCLFSQPQNIEYLHKAQSPYSVNGPAVVAAEAAIADHSYLTSYVTEALASRELLTNGLEKLGIRYVPSSANFVLGYFGDRAIEVRDSLRQNAILVRDRSYEISGGLRITVGTRAQAQRVLDELERIW
jgi:histidinol-phosphate aminotransferase